MTEAELTDTLALLKTSTKPADPAPNLIQVMSVSESKAYQPPPRHRAGGRQPYCARERLSDRGRARDRKEPCHRGSGRSRGDRLRWFGQKIHSRFHTIIIQNENGLYRLKQEFASLDENVLDPYLRISPPPPFGLCFQKEEFREQLKRLFDAFPPEVVIIDPWNAVSRDDKQKDYLESFGLVKETMPTGDQAPALGIVAHTRKPGPDERSNQGRKLLNLIAGSYVLGSIPRTVWVLQNATDSVTDNRVVVTCCKNNDGELGDRTAWIRDNGLWSPVTGFDWNAFDNPPRPGKGSSGGGIDENTVASVFDFGYKSLKAAEAVAELIKLTGFSRAQCYRAVKLDGPFKDHLVYDKKTRLFTWIP